MIYLEICIEDNNFEKKKRKKEREKKKRKKEREKKPAYNLL